MVDVPRALERAWILRLYCGNSVGGDTDRCLGSMGMRGNRGKRLVQPPMVAQLAFGKDRGEGIGAGGGGCSGVGPRLDGLVSAHRVR